MFKKKLVRTFLAIFLTLLPCLSLANDFISISFLGKQIGSIKIYEASNSDSRVIYIGGKISSSPLKIFNGKFEHKTIITKVNEAASKVHYESNVDAIFKHRKINYTVKNNRLITVNVSPKNETTKFTNPKQIDFVFIDPTRAITELLNKPCKNSFKIYDGRRVIGVNSIKPTSKSECGYVYKILKGPGHLSPFNFKTFKILTFFDQNGNSASKTMIVKTGPFKLVLNKVP